MSTLLKSLGLVLLLAGGIWWFQGARTGRTTHEATTLPPSSAAPEQGRLAATLPTSPGATIAERFTPPQGYERPAVDPQSFGFHLRHFPLLPAGSQVHLYDGRLKGRQDVHAAVLDIDVGKRDLQQCADAVMRLRAEYLRANDRQDEISFNFTNGFPAEWRRWKNGERIRVRGNTVNWVGGQPVSESEEVWRRYLTMVFSYAGTLSLARELAPVPLEQLEIGDVFIRGGSPGHAVIVVDKAVYPEREETAFLLAQSYMPAQEMHVLFNPIAEDPSPWYFVSQIGENFATPEWRFARGELKRFK